MSAGTERLARPMSSRVRSAAGRHHTELDTATAVSAIAEDVEEIELNDELGVVQVSPSDDVKPAQSGSAAINTEVPLDQSSGDGTQPQRRRGHQRHRRRRRPAPQLHSTASQSSSGPRHHSPAAATAAARHKHRAVAVATSDVNQQRVKTNELQDESIAADLIAVRDDGVGERQRKMTPTAAADSSHTDSPAAVQYNGIATADQSGTVATTETRIRKRRLTKHSAVRRQSTIKHHHHHQQQQQPSGYHQLDTSSNPEIKQWLRRKNRILRRRKAEERKQERQQRQAEEKAKRAAEQRRSESAKKVSAWMREKLLKERQAAQNCATITQADRISAVINETFALGSSTKPIDVTVTSKEHNQAVDDVKHSQHDDEEDQQIASDVNKSVMRCATSAIHVVTRLSSARSPRPSTTEPQHSAKQSSLSPSRISLPQSDVGRETGRARMTFDDWLTTKRRAAAARRQQQRQAAATTRWDPAETELIQQVARRRIDAILSRRKRVDSGLQRQQAAPLLSISNRAAASSAAADFSDGIAADSALVERTARRPTSLSAPPRRPPLLTASAAVTPRRTTSSPLHSIDLAASLPPTAVSGDGSGSGVRTERRAASAFPVRSPRPPAARPPSTRGTDQSQNSADQSTLDSSTSLTVKKLEAQTPPASPARPRVAASHAYRAVKYQQSSWNEFADHIWNDVNVAERGHRPEPVGSEQPSVIIIENANVADDSVQSFQLDAEYSKKPDADDDCTSAAIDSREPVSSSTLLDATLGSDNQCDSDDKTNFAVEAINQDMHHHHHHHQQQQQQTEGCFLALPDSDAAAADEAQLTSSIRDEDSEEPEDILHDATAIPFSDNSGNNHDDGDISDRPIADTAQSGNSNSDTDADSDRSGDAEIHRKRKQFFTMTSLCIPRIVINDGEIEATDNENETELDRVIVEDRISTDEQDV